MKFLAIFVITLFSQSIQPAHATITPDQLRQLAGSAIQCEQKEDDGDVTITFENCQQLQGSNPSCDVIANTDSDSKKLLTLATDNTNYILDDIQRIGLLDISDGNNDDGPWGPSLIYDRDCLMIQADGSGFFYHQRNDGTFWDLIFPLNEHMDFQNCKLTKKQ